MVVATWLGTFCLMIENISADEWRILNRDDEAIKERIRLIESAQQDISIACYNTDSGYVVTLIAEALAKRIQAGVRVRFLIDGLPARKMYGRLQQYETLGIEVKVFHPMGRQRPASLNRRLHSKIMICDDTSMILGSRNLTDPHFGQATENFVDCDYLITGEICGQGKQYFEWIWDHCGAVKLQDLTGPSPMDSDDCGPLGIKPLATGPGMAAPHSHTPHSNTRHSNTPHSSTRHSNCVDQISQWAGEERESTVEEYVEPLLIADSCEPLLSGTALPTELTLIHDRDFKKRQFSFEHLTCQAIKASSCRILLETPYPAFSLQLKHALIQAARRGIAITLFTNSSATTDRATTYAAFQNHKASLLRAGVELREYGGPGRIHAKGIIIDDTIALVGSYNFDPRGDRLNLELGLQITDPEFVSAVAATILDRNLNSRVLSLRESLLLSPGTPLLERLKIRSLQIVTPLLRRNL